MTITTPEQMREAAAKIAETHQVYQADVCAARIRAIPLAPQPAAVTVKPLVWYEPKIGVFWADTLIKMVNYRVFKIAEQWRAECGRIIGHYATIELAKAAAQADYEARILSALTIHPADPLSDPRVVALVDALNGCIAAIEHANMADGVCCCGDDMECHSDPMNCGHSPVDMGEYHAHQVLTAARAALRAIGGEA